MRQSAEGYISKTMVQDVLDYHCAVAHRNMIFFLWRPFLRDPDDDMVLELAVKAGCDYIVTHNVADFAGADQFGIQIATPAAFLQRIGGLT